MRWFYNLKIATKLLIGFVLVATIAGVVGVVGIINLRNIDSNYTDLFNDYGKPLNSLGDAMSNFQRVRSGERDLILEKGKDRSKYVDNIKVYNENLDNALLEFDKTIINEETRSQFEDMKSALAKLRTLQDQITTAAMADRSEEALALLRGEAQTLSTYVDEALNNLQDVKVTNGNQKSEDLSATTNTTIFILIIVVIIAMIVAIALGIFISRIISTPIKKLVDTAEKLAVGDVNVKVDSTTKDEIGNLMESFGKMIANVREQALAVEKIAVGNMNIDVKAKSDNDLLSKKLAEMIQTIKGLISEIGNLADSAVEGRLSVRGDERKYSGDYSTIINGINKTLDAVVQPIKEASVVLEEMSKGNLQVAVQGDYKGDHAAIKDAINDTINAFNEVLGNINSASEQVATGSRLVSASSQALSQGSTEQASSIEEISASIEEVASQTRQNAANANQANELASTAKEKAVQGNAQMAEMLKAMAEINDSSNSISKIIKVIDEIAFQTNILALNAAVEAARAGQHGKGFAVVAEEVRNLAARSANAAKETTAMIEGSIKKVDTGTKIANDTAAALNQIVDGVAKAADLVGEIATASNEQASGIAQVNQAITQVAQVVQNNSATSEESAAASEELSSQADLLKELVSKYKLKRNGFSKGNVASLTPEMLKMLDDMASKKRKPQYDEHLSEAAVTNVRIALDDKEFGKY